MHFRLFLFFQHRKFAHIGCNVWLPLAGQLQIRWRQQLTLPSLRIVGFRNQTKQKEELLKGKVHKKNKKKKLIKINFALTRTYIQ